ncbi:hypothetical protein [Nitrospirillum sp. BR 11828]|uniref:hypothetical protein n=1 Tax=Nitrospirillum sp. BR 11828 TaxID=3104325 RepID=UPI002ACA5A09|nr:hypothetical protein [Nitrospirillum sp. BR 11828]MDZ5649777.1 hypothetical protein [Nitrospirillum sp. BR 11828]
MSRPHPAGKPGATATSLGVRGRLLLAAVALLLPPLLGGALLLGGAYTRERRVAERHLDETAHMLALAVDQQLGQSQAYLRALVASPAMAAGDIAAVEAQARAIDLPKGYWFRLASAIDGHVLMNTALPPGAPLSGGNWAPTSRRPWTAAIAGSAPCSTAPSPTSRPSPCMSRCTGTAPPPMSCRWSCRRRNSPNC